MRSDHPSFQGQLPERLRAHPPVVLATEAREELTRAAQLIALALEGATDAANAIAMAECRLALARALIDAREVT